MPLIHRLQQISCTLLVFCVLAASAAAQIPSGLNYQGYLTDAAGAPLDGPVNVTFALYAAPAGGTPLWSESISIVPDQGLFATTLGAGGAPFPLGLFDTPLYMGVTVAGDAEMTPRNAVTGSAYAQRAVDADTLGGLPPTALDQSADVSNLSTTLSNTNSNVNALGANVSGNTAAIATNQSNVGNNASDISVLQADVAATESDVTALENTVPTLQSLVTGTCASGSSIRQIFSGGNVTCEIDDASLWSLFNNNLYYTAGSIGIGTTAPAAAIQIDAPLGVDPFRARVQSSTKLRVHQNGSVSVGTSSAGPENGLLVSGDALIGSGTATSRLTVSDVLWQASLDNTDVGGDDWFLGSSATGWAIGGGKFVISPTDNSTSAALVIDGNRDVGIGVSDPLTRLHLGGGSDVTPSNSGGYLTIGNVTSTNIAFDNNEIMARSNGVSTVLALNAEGGEVRINSGGDRDADSFEVRGRALFDSGENSGIRFTATTSFPTNALLEPTLFEEGLVGSSLRPFWRIYSREFYALNPIEYRTYSDRSLKKNVRPIDNALATITALEGVAYELATSPMGKRERPLTEKEEFDRRNQLGFVAQDVEKVLPQVVREDESSGLKSVGYMAVIPILVEALKEQQSQMNARQQQIDAQQKQIDAQQRQIDELLARL